MRRMVCVLLCLVLLTGCSGKRDELDRFMELRGTLLGNSGCSFDVVITADYGDKTQEFRLSCQGSSGGELTFTVAEPETIAGISGKIGETGGELTFADTALSFPLLADGELSPISAPWILLRTLRSGCVTACTTEGDLLRVSADDSYENDALHLDIWLRSDDTPVRAEITWKNMRILTLEIENFTI